MSGPTVRARRRVIAALVAVWLLVPALLMAARWPSWWAWIAPEQTPMTWVQSVVLVLAAAGSLLIAYLLRLSGDVIIRRNGGDAGAGEPGDAAMSVPPNVTAWWVLAAGFGALAFDERFAIHERVRDGVLAPRDVTVPFLPWVAAGDFLLIVVGLIGLAVLPMVWRAVRADRGARTALTAGVGVAVVAVGMDSIDPSTWTTQGERVQQTAEEIIELASGLAMLAAIALRLLGVLDGVAGSPGPADRSGRAVEEPTTPER